MHKTFQKASYVKSQRSERALYHREDIMEAVERFKKAYGH